MKWLQSKDCWEVGELEYHLAEQYDVVYESKQSYYDSLEAAGMSWKKTTQVNQGQSSLQWQTHCVRFAPNCPQQNPIEDVWLQAKTWIRRFCGLANSFPRLKWLFEWFLQNTTFDFSKLQMYGAFSKLNRIAMYAM